MKRLAYIIAFLMVSVVAMGQTTQGTSGKYINFVGGLQASEAFKLPVYSTNPAQNGLANQGRIWYDAVLNRFRGHDGTTVSNFCRENSVTLQMALNNGATGGTNNVIGLYHSSAANASSLELYDHLAQLTAGDNTLSIDNDAAGITSPFTVGAPTESNHAARYGETIPLSGTTTDLKISGSLEFTNTDGDAKSIYAKDADDYEIGFGLDRVISGVAFKTSNFYIKNTYTDVFGVTANNGLRFLRLYANSDPSDGFKFDPVDGGLIGEKDYSNVQPTNTNAYAQRQFVIDYVSAHGGSGSGTVTSVTGIAGETTVANGTTTPVIGISSTYTAARNSYADSAAASAASAKVSLTGNETIAGTKTFSSAPVVPTGSAGAGGTNAASQAYADTAATNAASGKQNTLVSGTNIKTVGGVTLLGSGDVSQVQNNLNASTSVAPSATAVNNELANYAKKLILDTSKSSITGTSAESVLKTFTVSANTLSAGRLKFDLLVSASGTANNRRFKIYRSTSNTFDGTAVLLSTSDLNTTNLAAQIGFDVYIRSDNTFVCWPAATAKFNPYAGTVSAPTTGSFPVASTNYIYVTCTNGSTADTGSVEAIAVEFLKQ